MDRFVGVVVMGALALGVSGCAATGQRAGGAGSGAVVVEDAVVFQDGRFVIAGQLSEAQLRGLGEEGVGVVVNSRTAAEVERLPFDEEALLREAGVRYVEIPLGGSEGFGPEDVDAFASAIAGAQGDIVVHCGSGRRARNLYAAYLVRYEGVSLEEAVARMERLGERASALELLLGEDLTVTRK